MRLTDLLTYFETSPAVALLRSPNAPFILDFLDGHFKKPGRISSSHSELVASLNTYREGLTEGYPGALPSRSEDYVSAWCSGETRWLRRYLEAGRDEPVYQLTPYTEDVYAFLERVLDQDLGFVGTESRLKLVIDTLEDLVVGASDDPQSRLEHLQNEEKRIQTEIAQIEADGRVATYHPQQIRERFLTAVSLLKQLQGDFRSVEESFRAITIQVRQQQAEGQRSRGGILEFALDAEDLLKQEDQGLSFYEFVRLILSPTQTEKLERIVETVRRLPELIDQQEGIETVRGMISLLQREAEKVMRTNQRLSATLRRLLDSQAHAERQRIADVLREIRGLAVSLSKSPPIDSVGIDVELDVAIESAFRRTFWSQPVAFEQIELTDFEADEGERRAAFQKLAAMHHLNWRSMRSRIRDVTAIKPAPTLRDLLKLYPPKAGVVEVIGYLQIARDDGHSIQPHVHERVLIPAGGQDEDWIELKVPLVTFAAATGNNDEQ